MRHSAIALLLVFVSNVAFAEKTITLKGANDPNCNIIKMPKDAYRIHSNIDIYLYPRRTPKDYTGCVTSWRESGHKFNTLHFEKGKLTWQRGRYLDQVRPYFCLFKNEKLVKNKSFNFDACETNTSTTD